MIELQGDNKLQKIGCTIVDVRTSTLVEGRADTGKEPQKEGTYAVLRKARYFAQYT